MSAVVIAFPIERFTFRALEERLARAARLGPSRPQVEHLSQQPLSPAGATAGGVLPRPSRYPNTEPVA